MPNDKQVVQEFPKFEGITNKEQQALKEFCKDHIDTQIQATLDFVPDMLKAQGLKVVPDVGWKNRAKQAAMVLAAATLGGYVGYKLAKRLDSSEEVAKEAELEVSSGRPMGGRRAAALHVN